MARRRRRANGSGSIQEHAGAFYLKFRVTELRNGVPTVAHKRVRLCDKTDRLYSEASVRADKEMRDKINGLLDASTTPASHDGTITDFWEKVYLPFAEAQLKASTVAGYKQIWDQFLKKEFGTMGLKEYQTVRGTQFLTALAAEVDPKTRAKRYGRNTINHIRSLASGIFTHAIAIGKGPQANPWQYASVLGKTKKPTNTKHYTLAEIRSVIGALKDRPDCQLIMALAFFAGLRPNEIAGLQWDDFDDGHVRIRRGCVRGVVDTPKTEESVASVPLISPVLFALKRWYEKAGVTKNRWVFENVRGSRCGQPMSLRNVARTVIIPILKEAGIEWKGFYAGRRGAGTALTELTGDAIAAQQILRHKTISITEAHYVKGMPESAMRGMNLLEQKVLSAGKEQ